MFVFLVMLVFTRIVIYWFIALVVEDIASIFKLKILILKITWGRIEINREGWSMAEKTPQHYNDMKTINTSKLSNPDKNIKISMTGNYT